MTLLEAYLGNDIAPMQQDALRRPQHYTEEHRELLQDLTDGRKKLEDVDARQLNDVFLTFTRETKLAEASEKVFEQAAKKASAFDDIEELEERRPYRPPIYEEEVQGLEPGDKVII